MTYLVQFRDWRDGSIARIPIEDRDEAIALGQEFMDATGLNFTRMGDTLGWDALRDDRNGVTLLAKLYIKEMK
jgi:hypothetical protein